jgi:biopolymer transport protein ExbB
MMQGFSILLAQGSPASVDPNAVRVSGGLWDLFAQSFDIFTVLLVFGSFLGVAIIFICILEVRARAIVPTPLITRLLDLTHAGMYEEARGVVQTDDSFLARVVRAAMPHLHQSRTAMREAAELAASEESARWFRKVEMLNLIGNLGPLVGLAGTVWGMILAFTSLGQTGGQAGPADLSLGISKALFHTLLGLCLAIPCLVAFAIFRARVDKLCTRAIVVASQIVERLPAREEAEVAGRKAS